MTLPRRLAAEALGTGLLAAAVIGSGIMADTLAAAPALALLANTLAAAAILVVLIAVLAPISGAHLNPAVSLVLALRGALRPFEAALYTAAQIAGAIAGALLAHAMFALPLALARTGRTGPSQWLSEGVASFGLFLVILGGLRVRPGALPWLVGLYIASAYWFTASTSFANPALTLARTLSDTFSGIRPADAPAFIAAQMAGALLASAFSRWLWPQPAAARS